ncbi:MAG: hypothetical protein ACRD3O_07670, partial [Terriglobia bacterium]
ALLKSRAESLLIQSIDRKSDEVWIRFHPEASINPENVMRFVRSHRDARVRPDGALRFRSASPKLIAEITSVLQELREPN